MTTDVTTAPCQKKLAGVGRPCGSTTAKRHSRGFAWCSGCGQKIRLDQISKEVK